MNRGKYAKAIECYETSIQIQKIFSPNISDLAAFYSNIGSVYNEMSEYSKALQYHEKDLEICQKILPANHPLLATPYNNIAFTYEDMTDYEKAVEYFERALYILQRSESVNHPKIESFKENIERVKGKL